MASLVRVLAIVAASVIALSFVFFAVDQLTEGSENQVRTARGDSSRAQSKAVIDTPAPAAPVERRREKNNSEIREFIDDGNDVLLSSFTGIVETKNLWAQRVVPGVIGLLLYGLLGLMLANALPAKKHKVEDWREAHG